MCFVFLSVLKLFEYVFKGLFINFFCYAYVGCKIDEFLCCCNVCIILYICSVDIEFCNIFIFVNDFSIIFMFLFCCVVFSYYVVRINRSTCRRFGVRFLFECIVVFMYEYLIGVRFCMYDWNFLLNVLMLFVNDGVGVSVLLKFDVFL